MKKILASFVFVICCSFLSSAQSMDEIETSFHQNTPISKIKVFPNPATNVVNILGLINSEKADISISDVYGNIVLEHHWGIKNNALSIPISILKSGIYIVTIRSQAQNVQTKFYKQ